MNRERSEAEMKIGLLLVDAGWRLSLLLVFVTLSKSYGRPVCAESESWGSSNFCFLR